MEKKMSSTIELEKSKRIVKILLYLIEEQKDYTAYGARFFLNNLFKRNIRKIKSSKQLKLSEKSDLRNIQRDLKLLHDLAPKKIEVILKNKAKYYHWKK